MKNPLPVQEIRELLGEKGFLRLYGPEPFLYISDAPRRVSADALLSMRQSLREHGFETQVEPKNLLLIDLQPTRWKTLLDSFEPAGELSFPQDETLHGVYALARLFKRHPSEFSKQPMEMIRVVLKRYAEKGGLQALAPQLTARCAEKLRCGQSLPSALADVLYVWLSEQS